MLVVGQGVVLSLGLPFSVVGVYWFCTLIGSCLSSDWFGEMA